MAKKQINNDDLLANIIKGIEDVKGENIDIVVHVFQKHIREYYRIESLWGDANITTIETKY